LGWAASCGATSYEYCLDTTDNNICDAGWISTGRSTVVSMSTPPGVPYYWQIRARNAAGTTEANAGAWWSFAGDSWFNKISPTNGATGQTPNVMLSWGGSYGATSYDYCSDTINNNACDTSWVSTGTATSVALSGLSANTTYYWQARANIGGFTTYANGVTGSATVYWSFTTRAGGSFPEPPSGFFASSIVGHVVTLRWTPPVTGPAPTEYVLEGGVTPGQVLASIPTGSAYPIYTLTAPTGSFYVRVHSTVGPVRSSASNEIRIHVSVPVVPSAPANLLALVNGSTVALAWRNTFEGGAPTSLILGVSGAIAGAFPLPLEDSASFSGVPAGTYTLALSATNAAGMGDWSNYVTVTVPGLCSGAPLTPTNFLAYNVGHTIYAMWDPAASGPAPTNYTLNVGGSYVGNVSTTSRSLSGTVGAGSYALSVAATNACGSSVFTAVQTVAILPGPGRWTQVFCA
jgi:hypothetical protein